MINQKQNRIIFLSVILFSAVLSPEVANAQTIKLSADQAHSNVGFSVPLGGGITRITGKYNDYDITINYVDSDMTKSSIEANIKSASISTGVPGRDEHLCTPDFFDAAKFPSITFISDSIRKKENSFIVFGTFMLHGISKKIQLPFTITGKDPGEGAMGFSSRTTVNRRDYFIGKDTMKPPAPGFVSDDIIVEIDFIAKPPKSHK